MGVWFLWTFVVSVIVSLTFTVVLYPLMRKTCNHIQYAMPMLLLLFIFLFTYYVFFVSICSLMGEVDSILLHSASRICRTEPKPNWNLKSTRIESKFWFGFGSKFWFGFGSYYLKPDRFRLARYSPAVGMLNWNSQVQFDVKAIIKVKHI